MNRIASNVFLIGMILAIGGVIWFMLRSPASAVVRVPETKPVGIGSDGPPKRHAVGMSGCLATACHGGPAASAISGKFDANSWQSSGSCWLASDPHSGAYDVLTEKPHNPLFEVKAAEIMKRLGRNVRATEDSSCLACHTNPALAMPEAGMYANLHELRNEGVSCEACHGNAGSWLREHTTWTPANREAKYKETGMNSLNDIGERALACAGCHIGAPADKERGYPVRDMNHDMIAAGHPRLEFDFGEYLRRLPRHWLEEDRSAKGNEPRGPGFPLRVWTVGRFAQAEASCRLLADRAGRASRNESSSPWPEFAEFNCAACHHDIPDAERSTGSRLGSRAPGILKWQSIWPLTQGKVSGSTKLEPLLKAMQARRPPASNDAEAKARDAMEELTKLRKEFAILSDVELAQKVKAEFVDPKVDSLNEDDLRQLYQGLAAIERTLIESKHPTTNWETAFGYARTKLRSKDWWQGRMLLGDLVKKVPLALP
jgi:hypothetical protein